MKAYPAREAVKNLSHLGDFAKWSDNGQLSADGLYEGVGGDMAGMRVYDGFIKLQVTPKFALAKEPRIFVSGSCFAREVERAFVEMQSRVLSWTPKCSVPNQFFHRYNTFAIANDFRAAINSASRDDRLLVETRKGWFDYSIYGPTKTRAELIAIRDELAVIHRRIADANVFVMTLGLVEAWYDQECGCYLNVAPEELSKHLSRYELRLTDYDENRVALMDAIAQIRKLNAGIKVILTVSPIPFIATFSGKDVVAANTLSKAILRSVAQAVADSDPNIDYFPSYEMVMFSDPARAWYPDHRHVRRNMAAHIIDQFRKAYVQ